MNISGSPQALENMQSIVKGTRHQPHTTQKQAPPSPSALSLDTKGMKSAELLKIKTECLNLFHDMHF